MTNEEAREILGVDATATPTEMKARYRTLARRYHPDVNDGDATAEWMFKRVSAARQQLNPRHPEPPPRARSRTEPSQPHGGDTYRNAPPPKPDWWAEMERRNQEDSEAWTIAIVSFAAGQGAGHLSAWQNWAGAAGPWRDVLYPIPFSVAVGLAVGAVTLITTTVFG